MNKRIVYQPKTLVNGPLTWTPDKGTCARGEAWAVCRPHEKIYELSKEKHTWVIKWKCRLCGKQGVDKIQGGLTSE